MQGYGDQHGVSPRAINELFTQVASMRGSWTYTLTLSMLEIYNETIRDLLDTSGAANKDKLEIRQAPEGNIVPGLTDVVVSHAVQLCVCVSVCVCLCVCVRERERERECVCLLCLSL